MVPNAFYKTAQAFSRKAIPIVDASLIFTVRIELFNKIKLLFLGNSVYSTNKNWVTPALEY